MDGLLDVGGVWVNLGPLNWRKEAGRGMPSWSVLFSSLTHAMRSLWLSPLVMCMFSQARLKLAWEEIARALATSCVHIHMFLKLRSGILSAVPTTFWLPECNNVFLLLHSAGLD